MAGRTGPFLRADRLLQSREFQHVARHGRRAVVRGFVVLAAPRADAQPGAGPRLGITVSRRVGNAVVRNRVKRRIREWFRRKRRALPEGLDLVVIGRRGAVGLSSEELCQQLREAGGQLGVLGR